MKEINCKEELELDFLRWHYHRQRQLSGDSREFETHIKNVYAQEMGSWFPYFIAGEKK